MTAHSALLPRTPLTRQRHYARCSRPRARQDRRAGRSLRVSDADGADRCAAKAREVDGHLLAAPPRSLGRVPAYGCRLPVALHADLLYSNTE